MGEGILPGGQPREADSTATAETAASAGPAQPAGSHWTAPGAPPPSPVPTPAGVAAGNGLEAAPSRYQSPAPAVASPTAAPGGAAYPPVAPRGPGPAWQPGWASAMTAHKPGIVALRPLSLGDIVEGGFASLRRNPRTFLGLAALTALVVLLVGGGLFLVGYLIASSVESTDAFDVFMGLGVTSYAVVMFFLSAATSIALSGILAYPVGEAVLGRRPSIGETWRRTRRLVPRLIGLCAVLVLPPALVFGLIVAGTVFAFVGDVPALGALGVLAIVGAGIAATWLGIRLALATPALVLEDLGVIRSLRRSWSLTSGLFWRTLGILTVSSLLIGIVQYILSLVLQLGGMLLALAVASMLAGGESDAVMGVAVMAASAGGGLVSGILTQPFLAAVTALLYTDSRIRKEGFDLALVRAAADAGRSPVR